VKLPALAFALFVVVARGADPALLAPAKDWSSNLFTKEGYHSMTLRGAEARFSETGDVHVVDLNLTVFSGDAANRVETVLLSSAATFRPKESTARGEKGVRLIRDDLEATGIRWSYDHGQKRVSLHEQVRIVFNAELHGLLK
jgi:lipopolysaccharide export system protein LptC